MVRMQSLTKSPNGKSPSSTELMELSSDDDDEQETLAVIRAKSSGLSPTIIHMNRSATSENGKSDKSSSTKSSPEAKKTPRAVVARPPTSYVKGGARKSKPKTSNKPQVVTKSPVVTQLSSSSDDEVLSKLAPARKSCTTTTPTKKPATPTKRSPKKSPSARSNVVNVFSPRTAKEKRFQRVCANLEKMKAASKTGDKEKKAYNNYVKQVVTTLLPVSDMERIPDVELRNEILKRHERYTEGEKIKRMSEAEKAHYLKEKAAAKRRLQVNTQKDNKPREDTIVATDTLPPPKPIEMPDGLPSVNFGDVLMTINFINSFAALLRPQESIRLVPEEFARALSEGVTGHAYLANVLSLLLHSLIHDDDAEVQHEMGVKLTDMELSPGSVGELVRLCLRQTEDEEDDEFSTHSDEREEDELVADLLTYEFFELSPTKKLKIIVALVQRLLESSAVDTFRQEAQQRLAEASKERWEAAVDLNKLKAEKTSTVAPTETEEQSVSTEKEEVANGNDAENLSAADSTDIVRVIKSRRLMIEQEKIRKVEKDRLEKERREKEIAEQKRVNRVEVAGRRLGETSSAFKSLTRIEPLGTDRNHDRYWYFGKHLPYIFVEKGWCTAPSPETTLSADNAWTDESLAETTFPKSRMNEWLIYDSVEDMSQLCEQLCKRGIRESKLKQSLEACLLYVKRGLSEPPKEPPQPVPTESIVDSFKEKLLQLELSIRLGSLGGVKDYDVWKMCVETAEDMDVLSEKLIQVMNNVRRTLLCGSMGVVTPTKSETKNSDVSEKDDENVSQSGVTAKWCDAVRSCRTWSRMHVLLSMLNACIRWDRSVEHAKCKICRRKHDDEAALICDSCNDVYHMYCLRPPLKSIPSGEWFCKSCKPRPTTRSEPKHSAVDDEQTGSSDDDQDNENGEGTYCIVCEVEDQPDELLSCSTCSSLFHPTCHDPPLRHMPRSSWRCCQCVQGRKIGRTRKQKKTATRSSSRKSSRPNSYALNSDLFDDEVSSQHSNSASGVKRKLSNSSGSDTSASTEGNSKKSSRTRCDDDVETVFSKCQRILDEIMRSRLANCLKAMPRVSVVSTRSHSPRNRARSTDLNEIQEKLGQYRTAEEFFNDLRAVTLFGKSVHKDNPRKLEHIVELELLINKLERAGPLDEADTPTAIKEESS